MNSKISLPELVDLLSQKSGRTKKDSESFLRELFGLALDVLLSEDFLKINGLGIFKRVWVEKRSSINVQTGLPYEIPGHYKLSFVPDKSMRDAVNAPFAFFESEILPDDSPLNVTGTVQEEAEVSAENDSPVEVRITENEKEVIEEEFKFETVRNIEPEKIESSNMKVPEDDLEIKEDEVVKSMEEREAVFTEREDEISEDEKEMEEEYSAVSSRYKGRVNFWAGFLTASVIIIACILLFIYFQGYENERKVNVAIDPVTVTIKKQNEDADKNKDTVSLVGTLVTDSIKTTAVVKDRNVVVAGKGQDIGATAIQESESEKAGLMNVDKRKTTESKIRQDVVTEVVRPGVFLTTIALKHYGNKAFWVYIYRENKSVIPNPNHVPVGTKLIIPEKSKYGINADDKNAIEKAKALATEILSEYE